MAIFQALSAYKRGVGLYADSSCNIEFVWPEIFLAPATKTLNLSTLKGAKVKTAVIKDGSTTPFSIVGNSVVFESVPSDDVLVVPTNAVDITQVIKSKTSTCIYVQAYTGQVVSNLSITSVDFYTDTVGKILFSTTSDGVFTDSLDISGLDSLWIKTTDIAVTVYSSTYLTITGDMHL